jgi:hypothetical protein
MGDLLGSLIWGAKNGQYCVIRGGSLQNPLGTNDILFRRTGNQSPNIISGELMELFMHDRHPTFILKDFVRFFGLCLRKVAAVGDLISYFTGRLDDSIS